MPQAMSAETLAEFKAQAAAHNNAVKQSLAAKVAIARAAVVDVITDAQRLLVADDPTIMTIRDVASTSGQNYLANLDQVILQHLPAPE